jgi:two-component system sensor histidine kinase ChiS
MFPPFKSMPYLGRWPALMRLLLAFCLGLTVMAGHAGGLRFEHLMTESGISVAETNAIVQDQQGFVWIGGSNGLARYNGHSFELFLHNPKDLRSLSNNFVWDLLVDHQGNLWVATTNGLNRFIPETQSFERYLNSSANPASLISNDVYTLLEDRDGQLWVGTRQGLDRFDPAKRGFRHFKHAPEDPGSISDNSITALYQDARGTLWVGTRRGLSQFNASSQTFSLFEYKARPDLFDTTLSIRALAEDETNNLWVGTDNGLFRFNQNTGEARHYLRDPTRPDSLSDNRVWKLLIDSKSNLWVATDHGGLNQYQHDSDSFLRYKHDPYDASSLASDQVREIFEDSAGDYWVALFPTGVDYADHTASVFTVYSHDPENPKSLSHDAVLSIASGPDKQVWVGTEGGLNLLDPEHNRFRHFRHNPADKTSLSANAVLAITQDKAGRYWFGTWSGGLNLYQPETGTFKRFLPDADNRNSISSPYVWSLLGDSQGYVWIGTESGDLDRYDPGTGTFTHFTPNIEDPAALSGGFMRALLEDSKGTIWVGTLQGLNRFDAATQTFTRFQHQQGNASSLPHNAVATLFEDSQQRLWVGTESGLALLLDAESGRFRTFSGDQGLPNDSIMGLHEDDRGFLWINTLNGLSRFDPEREVFTNYSRLNGLAGNIMNRPAIHFADSGDLWVGSTKGLTRFRPDGVRDNPLVPPMVFTSFRVFNQEVAIGPEALLQQHIQYSDHVVLDYKTTMFSLHFAALSYRNSAANQYAYRMQGFDDQWIQAGNNHGATYTNLNPGNYLFTVKGSNNNGVWNETGRSMRITVLPPPWRTWWAYSIYGLMVLAVIYAFVQSQRRKVAFEKQKVAHLRAIDKLKDEFLANTSHELRTPLNGIIGLSESLIDDQDAEMSEKVRNYLKMIAGSGRRLSNLINDILDFSKIKNHGMELHLKPTDFANVCEAVCTMSQPLADKKAIRLIRDLPENLPPVMADENRLQQILYNLIGNAIKFTFSGHVKVYTSWDKEFVTIHVEDTGIGIPESDLGSIFESFTQAHGDAAREFEGTGLGLAVAKNLIELHGGNIAVTSEINKGSTFRFSLKISEQPVTDAARAMDAQTRLNSVMDIYGENDMEVVVTESPNVDSCKFHILVVDDDPINRQVLIGQLSLHNYRISEASNGQEAVEKIKSDGSVDLVLLDVMMPRMTGYEAAMQIRAIKPVHELPIIFITAKHLASDLVAGFVAGGNDFLIKPVSKNELLSRTKTHLLLLDVTRNLENIVEERTNTLREAQKSLETVDNIVNLINQQSSLEGLARILLKESAQLLGEKVLGAFWLLNERGSAYNLISVQGGEIASQLFPTGIPFKLVEECSGMGLLKHGVQILLPAGGIEFVPRAVEKIDSALVMAIETDNQLAALLMFVNRLGEGLFTERDQQVFARLETHALSAVSKARMLEALRRQNHKLEEISYTDQLTQLHNRRHLIRHLQGDLALCKRRYQVAEAQQQYPQDADLLFLLVDIDHFKPVNDTYGHNAGDAILKGFSGVLKKVFRESDHLIRWGGEEFLVVVRFFYRKGAINLVERFRREVELTEFDIGNGNKLKITCSIGFSCYPFYQNRPEAYTWEQVVEIADQCLYAAKKTQRNAWVGAYGSSEDAIALSFEEVHSNIETAINSKSVKLLTSINADKVLKWE